MQVPRPSKCSLTMGIPSLLPSRLLSSEVTPASGPHGIQEAREGAPPGVCEGSMLGPDSVGGWGQHPAERSLIRTAQRGGWYGYPGTHKAPGLQGHLPRDLFGHGHRGGGGGEVSGNLLQTILCLPPAPPRLASMQVTGSVTSASPAPAQQTWRRWRPPPTWACPGAGRSESMMPRCAWGAAAIQVRGWSQRLRAVGVGVAQGVGG